MVISGCTFTITVDVTADNTPNMLIISSNPDKALTASDTVSIDKFVSP